MPKQKIRWMVVSALAAIFLASLAMAQDNSALLGKWKMTSQTGQDAVVWNLVLKEMDGKLIAILASDQGEAPAKDFTYEGGVLKFKAPYDGVDYAIELKLVGAELDGTWSGGDNSGKTHGVKAT
jgi:hypothetical protein